MSDKAYSELAAEVDALRAVIRRDKEQYDALAAERDALRADAELGRLVRELVERDHDERDSDDGITLAKMDAICYEAEPGEEHQHVYMVDTDTDNTGDGSLIAALRAAHDAAQHESEERQ